MLVEFTLDGEPVQAGSKTRLSDLLLGRNTRVPHICYHRQLGPIQTCDTCMVVVNGNLARACATLVEPGMCVETQSTRATTAQRKAFDHILANHLLYCTVCDNN